MRTISKKTNRRGLAFLKDLYQRCDEGKNVVSVKVLSHTLSNEKIIQLCEFHQVPPNISRKQLVALEIIQYFPAANGVSSRILWVGNKPNPRMVDRMIRHAYDVKHHLPFSQIEVKKEEKKTAPVVTTPAPVVAKTDAKANKTKMDIVLGRFDELNMGQTNVATLLLSQNGDIKLNLETMQTIVKLFTSLHEKVAKLETDLRKRDKLMNHNELLSGIRTNNDLVESLRDEIQKMNEKDRRQMLLDFAEEVRALENKDE